MACLCLLTVGYAEYALLVEETKDVQALGTKAIRVGAFGDGVPVAQTFTMTSDGLEAVGVQFSTSRPASLRVECELLQLRPDSPGGYETIYRWTEMVEEVSGTEWRTIRFTPVASSMNRVYQIRLQLKGVHERAGELPSPTTDRVQVGIMAWADNPLRLATLLIDGREQWGDLMFFARATGRTRYERLRVTVGPSLPRLFRHPLVQLVLLLVYDLALVLAVCTAVLRTDSLRPPGDRERPLETARGEDEARTRGRWSRLLVAVAAMITVFGTLAWAVHRDREVTAIDLIEELDTAIKESPAGLHGGFDLVDETINGKRLLAIFAHPTSRIRWDIDVPVHSELRTHLALVSGIWEQFGDGVVFRVGVSEGGVYHELFARQVNPIGLLEDRAWLPVRVDLSAYAGRRVALILETLPGPANDASYDWALWGFPRVVFTSS